MNRYALDAQIYEHWARSTKRNDIQQKVLRICMNNREKHEERTEGMNQNGTFA